MNGRKEKKRNTSEAIHSRQKKAASILDAREQEDLGSWGRRGKSCVPPGSGTRGEDVAVRRIIRGNFRDSGSAFAAAGGTSSCIEKGGERKRDYRRGGQVSLSRETKNRYNLGNESRRLAEHHGNNPAGSNPSRQKSFRLRGRGGGERESRRGARRLAFKNKGLDTRYTNEGKLRKKPD